ncbi:MAG: transglutaminase family protein [Pseudolabrys sp.]|jgi:transglutaminase-like putative cysteine protease
MLIKIGYDISYTAAAPTPMVVMLSVHPSRVADLVEPENIVCDPPTPLHYYHDSFGNWCGRLVIPPGKLTLSNRATVRDSGLPDVVMPDAQQIPVENLPDDIILFLLASRYCEIDRMMDLAWSLFKDTPMGWGRVQAICDYVHNHLTFGYQFAAPTKSAHDVHAERRGVCRDFAHLAVTLCRCMNIPARYCTGYLGDIGVPPEDSPMDFSAWFEVYLSGRWFTFDARHNTPRIGRILMGRGRDAADVPLSTGFGYTELSGFKIYTDEVIEH